MKALVKLLTISALIFTATFHAPAADCESQPAAVFYQYIRELYYAKNITQVAKYWVSTTRIPFINLKGQAAAYELQKLKTGYVFNPRINSQVMQGQRCLMKGTGTASDLGRTFPCKLDVIMYHEDGSWRIQYYVWSATIMQ